jgi:mRNA-degrading endonuclease RelE of RelBE toxin-antitoxin system
MKIAYHPSFLRQFKKLSKDLQTEAKEKVKVFEKDHRDPVLKLHKLK